MFSGYPSDSERFIGLGMRKTQSTDIVRKPCPVHHADKRLAALEAKLGRDKIQHVPLTLGRKANGWRALLVYAANDQLELYTCKKEEEIFETAAVFEAEALAREANTHRDKTPLLPPFANRGRYLNPDTIPVGTVLFVEACASFRGTQEMGHNFVRAALTAFQKNGFSNPPSEPIHLQLQIFWLHSVRQKTPRRPQHVMEYLDTVPVRGNNVVSVVPYEKFSIQLRYGQSAYYDSKEKILCRSSEEFLKQQLDRLHVSGWEGFVLLWPEEFSEATAIQDSLEGWRNPSALKIKHEPRLTCVAMKVEDHTGRKAMRDDAQIYLYCRKGEHLVYAGDASDNTAIREKLSRKTAAWTFKDETERQRLFSLTMDDLRNSGVQIEVSVVHITAKGFLTGIKRYGVKAHSHIEFHRLSVAADVAARNAHLSALHKVRAEYEKLKGVMEDENPFKKPAWKPPIIRPTAVSVPVRQPSPEQQPSPERQHSPEPPAPAPVPPPVLPEKRKEPSGPFARQMHRIQYIRATPAPPPTPEPAAPPKPAAPVARPRPTDEEYTRVLEQQWVQYSERLRQPFRQENYYYEGGAKVPLDAAIPYVPKPDGSGQHDGPWPVVTTWPVKDASSGEYFMRTVYVGKPEYEGKRQRLHVKRTVFPKVYLDESDAQDDSLRDKIHYFGGDVVTAIGADVDFALVGSFALSAFAAGKTENKCYRLKAQMPQVRFTTEEGLAVALR